MKKEKIFHPCLKFLLIVQIMALIILASGSEIHAQSKRLYKAIKKENYEKVKKLIEVKGINTNVFVTDNTTALMFACELGHLKIVRYLIRQGVDVSKPNEKGTTPLMVAAGSGNLQVVKLLLREGAFINSEDKDVKTAVEYATKNGQIKVARYLKSKGGKRGFEL